MVEVNITSNQKIVQDELGRIISQIPETEEEFSREMMEVVVDEISKSADKRFGEFSGNMQDEISMDNVDITSTGSGTTLTLKMQGETGRGADYLAWNEYATEGHWVPVTLENVPIRSWVDQKLTKSPDFLYVTPTPFVKPAVQRIGRRARNKAESEDNAIGRLSNREV